MTTHFLAECLATPWALQPERLSAYAALLARRMASRHAAAHGAFLQVATLAAAPHAGGLDEDDHGAPLKPQAAAPRPGLAPALRVAPRPLGHLQGLRGQGPADHGGHRSSRLPMSHSPADKDEG